MEQSQSLKILQEKFKGIKTGGKGSIRRKRVPSKKNKKSTDSNEARQLLNSVENLKKKVVEFVNIDTLVDCNKYISIFTSEFCNSIGKGHRKSNRPSNDHYTTMRTKIAEYLEIESFSECDGGDINVKVSDNLFNYCLKNFSPQALKQIVTLVEIINEIVKDQEYEGYIATQVPKEDTALIQLYSDMKMDFSVKMIPTALRNHYLNNINSIETNDGEARDKMKAAYFSILKMISDKDSVSGNNNEEDLPNEDDVQELLNSSPSTN